MIDDPSGDAVAAAGPLAAPHPLGLPGSISAPTPAGSAEERRIADAQALARSTGVDPLERHPEQP